MIGCPNARGIYHNRFLAVKRPPARDGIVYLDQLD
jgi:hypothetical protein